MAGVCLHRNRGRRAPALGIPAGASEVAVPWFTNRCPEALAAVPKLWSRSFGDFVSTRSNVGVREAAFGWDATPASTASMVLARGGAFALRPRASQTVHGPLAFPADSASAERRTDW